MKVSRMPSAPLEVTNQNELELMANYLRDSIMSAYEESCKEIKTKGNYFMEWFNPKLHSERTKLRKLFSHTKIMKERNPDRGTAIENLYKDKRDQYRKLCQKTKREAWFKKMESLDNTKDNARLQKILKSSKSPEISPLIMSNGKYSANNEEVIEELMKTHFPDCRPMINNRAVEDHRPIQSEEVWNDDIEETLQKDKIGWAIKCLSPFKSPGVDGIFPALLQKADDVIIPILATLFKASVKLNYIPTSWRGIFVTFIPKADKVSYDKAKSFRPISLMSFILKVLEKVIDRRIREKNLILKPLSNSKHAYQQGKGTESALHYLVTEIEKNTRNEDISLVVGLQGSK